MNPVKIYLLCASSGGLLAVALGAFGAHALKARLGPAMLSVWQTAVSYQFYHVLALMLVALLLHLGWQSRWLLAAGVCFIGGIVLFSGSLYWLALGGPKWLGPITPVGGLSFMMGWIMLFVAGLKLP